MTRRLTIAVLFLAGSGLLHGQQMQQQMPPPMPQPFPQQFPQQMPPPMPVDPTASPAGAAMIQPTPDVQSRVIRIRSPYRSRARSLKIAEQVALDVTLQLGYKETPEADARRAAALSGAIDRRHFTKMVGDEQRTLDLFLIQQGDGAYDVVAHGLAVSPRGETDNLDLPTLVSRLTQAASPSAASQSGPPSLQHVMYQLSYIQGDQALAMLKALGYPTIEFSKQIGDSAFESLYEPMRKGDATRVPYIIKFVDAPKTSLMDPFVNPGAVPGMMPQTGGFPGQQSRGAIPDIGGTFLHHMTSGEPQQRLLIVYDASRIDDLETVLNVLRETIDVPAQQVVISALIVEVNTDRVRDLGITFTAGNGQNRFTFNTDPQTGTQLPFTYTFDRFAPITPVQFNASLNALIRSGDAEILSNPSVLVLDGRQARIQIGQQVPVVNSTATAAGITSSVEYFPVGIVLNLRPRINEDSTEVTMQVETIVSAVGQNTASGSSVFFAPTIDNRQVQTFVRVADNTPFIIGGLIASDRENDRSGIPFLSQVPYLGSLFRRSTVARTKREVIVVLTPHVVPLEDKSFSYVIPKDSDTFDTFGYQLFRNAYRIRNRDVFDLRFVYESEVFQQLVAAVRARAEVDGAIRNAEPYKSLIAGVAPGEEILVRRMMWEIIRKLRSGDAIEANHMIFFQPSPEDAQSTDFVLSFLDRSLAQRSPAQNALVLTFDAASRGTAEHPFVQPKALVSYINVTKETYEKELIARNTRNPDGTPKQWSIILSDQSSSAVAPIDILRAVLVLKRLLAVNSTLPLTIKEFRVGRQIIFPTEQDITQTFHVIDRDAARLFYEVMQYYRAFEQQFNAETRAIAERMRQ